ncbi:PEPxxWA-CTERM sorting domain-containing protein [Gimibacter soli]|uniref:PEPxxWA-CTERM sorting domain-containing protein n=1 Tax=Gimibacter soli TaxID=3024400 RepID=A0AAF0BNB8_9PROT|nr:PEPxxWA-CTERM sorting domain-containing protein [Gimibacter soli]WCL55756.1 PEPxxWA-CTERM sorting domain-containing protein [Gimibacter soli]
MVRRILSAALISVGLTASASAAVTVFEFSGSAHFRDSDAGLFGLSVAENGGSNFFENVVTATLRIDMDAAPYSYNVNENQKSAVYFYDSFSVTIGDKTFLSSSLDGALNSVTVFSGIPDGFNETTDFVRVRMWDVTDTMSLVHGFNINLEAANSSGETFDEPALEELYAFNSINEYDYHFTDGEFALGDNPGNPERNWFYGVRLVSVTSAVPEPSTWLMMLGGFGAAGAAARRRGRRLVKAAI